MEKVSRRNVLKCSAVCAFAASCVPRSVEAYGEPINIGNPSEFTIRQLAEIVVTKVGGRSRLVTQPLPQDDPLQRRPDISLAIKELEWRPSVQLEEGLDRTIAYFRKVVGGDIPAMAEDVFVV